MAAIPGASTAPPPPSPDGTAVDADPLEAATLPLAKRRAQGRPEKHANLRQPTDWHIQPGGSKKSNCVSATLRSSKVRSGSSGP
eukprot:12894559-Prorocentrum_lima.AAC.1